MRGLSFILGHSVVATPWLLLTTPTLLSALQRWLSLYSMAAASASISNLLLKYPDFFYFLSDSIRWGPFIGGATCHQGLLGCLSSVISIRCLLLSLGGRLSSWINNTVCTSSLPHEIMVALMIDYLWSIGPVVSLFFGSTPIIGELQLLILHTFYIDVWCMITEYTK